MANRGRAHQLLSGTHAIIGVIDGRIDAILRMAYNIDVASFRVYHEARPTDHGKPLIFMEKLMEKLMDEQIDNIPTEDFRFEKLGSTRNVLLNKREENSIDVVLVGADIHKGQRILLTRTGEREVDTAWIVASSTNIRDEERNLDSYHCLLTFEGTVIP